MGESCPPLDKDTRVRTVAIPHPADDWDAEAIPHRKFSVLGTIIAHHDSHGLCYDVRHEDGTVGCYDSRELVVQIEGCDVQVAEILEILAQWGWDRHVSFKEVQNALYEEIKKRRIQDAHRIGKR